jgi:VanZ family protein
VRLAAAIVWMMAWAFFGVPWDGSTADFSAHRILWTLVPSTNRQVLDVVLNFVFYIPLGILLRWFGITPLRALACAALLSAGTETLQLFSPTRVPNLADIVSNTAGVAVGLVLVRGGPRNAS